MKLHRDKHDEILKFKDPDDNPCIICAKNAKREIRQSFTTDKQKKALQPLQIIQRISVKRWKLCPSMDRERSRYFCDIYR